MIMSLDEGRLQGCRGPADGSLEIVRDGSGWVTVRMLTSSLAALGDRQLDAPEARRAGADLLSPRVADDLRRILPRVARVAEGHGRRGPGRAQAAPRPCRMGVTNGNQDH